MAVEAGKSDRDKLEMTLREWREENEQTKRGLEERLLKIEKDSERTQ